jgi:hypothetical protein
MKIETLRMKRTSKLLDEKSLGSGLALVKDREKPQEPW